MVDLGCTGRKDGQTDSTRTRERKDKQSRAVEHYWQEVGRHKVSMLRADTSGCYEDYREVEGKLVFNRLMKLNKSKWQQFLRRSHLYCLTGAFILFYTAFRLFINTHNAFCCTTTL